MRMVFFITLIKKFLKKKKFIKKKDQKIFAMINFKEIKNANQLDKLLNDKKGILDGVRFAVPPSKINKLNIIINKISKKYKNISFNVNLMYLSKWIYNEKNFR